MALKVKMEGDASGMLKALADVDAGLAKLRSGLGKTEREATGLGEKLKALAGGVITGGLHRLGELLVNAILAPLRLGIKLAGELLSALGRLASAQVSKGVALFRESQTGSLGRPQLNAGQQKEFQSYLDDLTKRTGFRDLQGAGNKALEYGGGIAGAKRLLQLATDTAAARGGSVDSYVEGFGRAQAYGDIGGLMGLGLNDMELQKQMSFRRDMYKRQLSAQAIQQRFGFSPAFVGGGALQGPAAEWVDREAEMRAGRDVAGMAMGQIGGRFSGAGAMRGSLYPEDQLSAMFDPSRRTWGGAAVAWGQRMLGKLAPGAGRLNAAMEGTDPMSFAGGVFNQFASGNAGKMIADAFKGSDIQAALKELLMSTQETFAAIFAYAVNKALDAIGDRSPKLREMLGLTTSRERRDATRGAEAIKLLNKGTKMTDDELASLVGSTPQSLGPERMTELRREHASRLRKQRNLDWQAAQDRSAYSEWNPMAWGMEGRNYWLGRKPRTVSKKDETSILAHSTNLAKAHGYDLQGYDPDAAAVTNAVGRSGRAVKRGLGALEDGAVRAMNAAADIGEAAAADAALTNAHIRLKPAGSPP